MTTPETERTAYMEPPPMGTVGGITQQAAPRRLGKYSLSNVIGAGSMGIVYKSLDPHTKRTVAVKTIRHELLEDDAEDCAARLRIEAQAVTSFSHPGIVAVQEYGEESGYAYIAMEYVEGRSLRDCFEQKVRFSVEQVIDIQSQLLKALQYAHDRGVWHRDIKPANILITSNGRVKVTDFGIARIEAPMLTQPSALMGTPGYVAPEVYVTGTFDHRIDVFAAGAVLYQLLANTPAFAGTPDEIMQKVCYETPLPPSVAGRQPSMEAFDATVLRALARRPEERWPSAALFLEALLEAHAHAIGPADASETIVGGRPSVPARATVPITPPLSGPSPATVLVNPLPSTNAAPEADWDTDELARIQKRLARYVGPIARVMVDRAARETTDLVLLTQWLAAKISSSADREGFLKDAGIAAASEVVPQRPTSGPEAFGGRQYGNAGPARRPLTREDIARASRLLVVHLGPIAPLLAKRAAQQPGCSREQFIAALAAHLRDDSERARFLSTLG